MTNLPASWAEPTVPTDAPRPTQKWLAATILGLLSIYYQPDEADPIFEAAIALWLASISSANLPKIAIEKAVIERTKWKGRGRPIPGEIIDLAKSYIIRPSSPPELRVVGDPPTDESKARVSQMMRDHGFGHLCKMPAAGPIGVIMQMAASVAGVTVADIISHRRDPASYQARLAAVVLIRRHTSKTYPQMAKAFDRDPSHLQAAVGKAGKLAASDPDFANFVKEIERRLAE